MSITSLIEKKQDTEELKLLWSSIKRLTDDCIHHLSLIASQLKDYDVHDEKHSNRVLENIEALLRGKADVICSKGSLKKALLSHQGSRPSVAIRAKVTKRLA